MNFPRKTLLASLLLLSATNVFAVDTAILKVIGTIAPTACTPVFASGGTVDYGLIPTASLSPTVATNLATKPISYTVTCDAAIPIAMAWTDARNGTAPAVSAFNFGLGKQDANNIGQYNIKIVSGTGDGTPVDMIISDSGHPWSAGAGTNVQHDYDRLTSFATAGTVVPGSFMEYAGNFDVTATIAPTSTLDLSRTITLDGLATLEIRYL